MDADTKNVVNQVSGLKPMQFHEFGKGLSTLERKKANDLFNSFTTGLIESGHDDTVIETMKGLSNEKKKKIANGADFSNPSGRIRDRLWYIVISSFAFVLIGAFITLALSIFIRVPKGEEALVKPEIILTIFTTVVGFLGGLFVPSPTTKEEGTT